jgi:hypothetical protein
MFDTVPAEWVAEYAQSLKPRLVSQEFDAEADESSDDDDDAEATTAIHYISSVEGMRVRLLLGPFTNPREAALWTHAARDLLMEQGQVAAAYSVRVTKVLSDPLFARTGELNYLLGADSAS